MGITFIQPQAVLFDWDNTLVNTWPTIHKALHSTFVDYGLTPWTLEETKARVAHSMKDAFPTLFGDKWEEAGKAYQQHYRNEHLQELELLPGAEETVKWLQETGVPMALVSNKRGNTLRTEVEHLGWGHYFEAALGSGDAEHDKPHAAPILAALEMMNIEESAPIWYIGDSGVDLEISANSGALPILFGKDADTTPAADGTGEYKGFVFVHHAPDHADLLNIFKQNITIEL